MLSLQFLIFSFFNSLLFWKYWTFLTILFRSFFNFFKHFSYRNLIVRPVIEPFNFPTSLQSGQRFNVLCSVIKGDPPIKIKWYKDGDLITSNDGKGIQVMEVTDFSSSLVFGSLGPQHRGNYTCLASNIAGTAQHNETMIIHGKWLLIYQSNPAL